MNKIKVQIDRAKWRTGANGKNKTGKGYTQLRNEEGYCCCLGFISEKVTTVPTRCTYHPQGLQCLIPEITYLHDMDSYLPYRDTALAISAMRINDDETTTALDKERLLLDLFKDTCYELEFVGSYKE